MLFVIDMQNDFIDQKHGKMAIKDADKLIIPIKKKIKEYREAGDVVIFTKDSHLEVYKDKEISENQIVWGHDIVDALKKDFQECESFEKKYHGICPDKLLSLKEKYGQNKKYLEMIEFVGIETHKCVFSNAVLVQNSFPDSPIYIDEDYVMSSDDQLHSQALNIMENLKMKVRRNKA